RLREPRVLAPRIELEQDLPGLDALSLCDRPAQHRLRELGLHGDAVPLERADETAVVVARAGAGEGREHEAEQTAGQRSHAASLNPCSSSASVCAASTSASMSSAANMRRQIDAAASGNSVK